MDVQELAASLTRVVAQPIPHEQRIAELACPVCSATMKRVQIPETIYSVDVCNDHGTWFDRGEMAMFASIFARRRAGDLTEEDLQNAGLPGASTKPGGGGFFSDFFAALGALLAK